MRSWLRRLVYGRPLRMANVTLGVHALRLAEQAMFDARGTWIPQVMTVRVGTAAPRPAQREYVRRTDV